MARRRRGITPAALIPDALTVSRGVCALLLLFCRPLSAVFFALYIYCGASDMLDGPLARRLGTSGRRGAMLDSAADLIFAASLLISLLPALDTEPWMLAWAGFVCALKLTTLIVGAVKYRSLPYLHTYANKATGFVLFCFPALIPALGLTAAACICCAAAGAAAAEELAITLSAPVLDAERVSIFAPPR